MHRRKSTLPNLPRQFAPLWTHLREQGFSSLFLDLDPDTHGRPPSEILALMEDEMVRLLRHPPPEVGVPPFPPALTAAGAVCAVAEQYASSHPLSALQLVDPPLSMARAAVDYPHLLGPEALPEFHFVPFFPARVVWTARALAEREARQVPWFERHRIEAQRDDDEGDVDRYEWASLEQGADEMGRWLEDDAGLYVCATHPS